jgi:hypothetical protein
MKAVAAAESGYCASLLLVFLLLIVVPQRLQADGTLLHLLFLFLPPIPYNSLSRLLLWHSH